jgi:hypothetical protein
MFSQTTPSRRRAGLWLSSSILLSAGLAVDAVEPAPVPADPQPAALGEPQGGGLLPNPSQNVTINLINRLVQHGILPKTEAQELIKQAEADTALANAQAQALQGTVAQVAAAQAATQVAEPMPSAEDALRVTYVPETVKRQLREEVREEVMARARKENWAAPNAVPSWVSSIRLFGDVRTRFDGSYFSEGNDVEAFPDFNAINTALPYDVSGTLLPPHLNVDQDRDRLRLRVRFGVEAILGDGFSAGVRLATGANNTPVSVNQSMGLAGQTQGGNFSKYAIWLDRGFLKYELGGMPTRNLAVTLGRFDNPFFCTDMVWDDDLGFDGLAFQAKYEVRDGVVPFLTAGAFPVFNTDFNFATNRTTKFESSDKWLYAAQIGTDWKINKDFSLKLGTAYYHFDNVEGQLSKPYTPVNAQDAGNTDNTRPSFAQKGNSYMMLRDIVDNALNNFGNTNQYQYFGLGTPFQEFAVTGRLDFSRFDPFHLTLTGEYVKNLAFNGDRLERLAVNNRASLPSNAEPFTKGAFAGGDNAWNVNFKVGSPALEKRWDWNVGVGYRYVESDAVVDGFSDSAFGLGGTNLKGYTFYGVVALSPRVNFGVRWMTSREVAGPPLKVDILQVDLGGKF